MAAVVETEFERANNCPPFTASVLFEVRLPLATLLSTPLENEIVGAANRTPVFPASLMTPSAPTVRYVLGLDEPACITTPLKFAPVTPVSQSVVVVALL